MGANDKESFSKGAWALMMAGVMIGNGEIGGEGRIMLVRGKSRAVIRRAVSENTRVQA